MKNRKPIADDRKGRRQSEEPGQEEHHQGHDDRRDRSGEEPGAGRFSPAGRFVHEKERRIVGRLFRNRWTPRLARDAQEGRQDPPPGEKGSTQCARDF